MYEYLEQTEKFSRKVFSVTTQLKVITRVMQALREREDFLKRYQLIIRFNCEWHRAYFKATDGLILKQLKWVDF